MERKSPKRLKPAPSVIPQTQGSSQPDNELGGLETLLAMAAVEPDFAQALATRRDEVLAASGVVVSAQEQRILQATPSENLRLMSASLEQRIPAGSRRTFLLRAGQCLTLLAGATLLPRGSEAAPATPSNTQVWWESSEPRGGLSGGRGTGSRPNPEPWPPRPRPRPRKAGYGRVWLRSVKTKGPISRGSVRKIMRRHLNEIRYFYQIALSKQPKLKGELKVQFLISPLGRAVRSKLVSSSLRNPALEKQVVRAIRRWRFPPASKGGLTFVTAKYRFRPIKRKRKRSTETPQT